MNTNNKEVEAKVLETCHKEMEGRIKELGAEKVFDGELDAVWLRNVNGEKVRVRKEAADTVVEFKEILSQAGGVKKSEEIGFNSDNHENTLEIFKRLGFAQENRNIKNRVSYLIQDFDGHGKVRFDFDDYTLIDDGVEIPEFMEIEADTREVIVKVALILGIKEEELKDWGVKELVEHYRK